MVTALPANVNLTQLLAANPGTTIVGTEPLESVQSGTSVAFTLNQVLSFAQSNFSIGNLVSMPGLSVLGVTGNATATAAAIAGTTDQVFRVAQNGTTLSFGAINLATTAAVTGTLPVRDGGMGTASLSAFSVLFAGITATAPLQQAVATTASYPLVSNGSASLAGFQALNLGSAGVTGTLGTTRGGTGDSGTAWANYTATLSPGGGGFVSASAAGRFKTIGKTVFFQLNYVITTVGTATGGLVASLPVTAGPVAYSIAGQTSDFLALSGAIATSGTSITFQRYDAGGICTTARSGFITGVYESV